MTDDRVWSRRRWLAAAGSATAAALAGCSSSDDNGDGSGSSPGNGASPDGQGTTNSSGPVTAEGEWPMEHFGAANSASTSALSGPSGPVTERWSKEIGGTRVRPVVRGDTVYVPLNEVGCYAFDLLSGEQRWMIESESPFITMAADSDTVYLSKSSQKFTAHDPATGDIRWEYDSVGSTHVRVVDGTIYLVVDDGLVALDREGSRQMKITLPSKPAQPAISDGTVFLQYGEKIGAYDATTGEQQWERSFELPGYNSGIVADDERIYHIEDSQIQARNRATGERNWSWNEGSLKKYIPTVADGVVYADITPEEGVAAIDGKTGNTVDRYEFEGVTSRLSVAQEMMYVLGTDTVDFSKIRIFAIDLAAGSIAWKTEFESPGKGAWGPPVVLEELLLFKHGQTFSAFETA